jgi:AcrR family transcriptional regulator
MTPYVYDVNMKRGYHHGDLRHALVAHATEALRAGEEPSLRRLAGEVGVSPSAVYRHFADHSAVLDAVAAGWLDSLGQTMATVTDAGPIADDTLVALCQVYLDAAIEDPHLFRLASGPHGFGRPGGVLGAAPDGPLPQQHFLRAAPLQSAEAAWITSHGLAVLTIDGPYSPEDARLMLPRLLAALQRTSTPA